MSQGINCPSPAGGCTGHHTGPSHVGTRRTLGMNVERAALAKILFLNRAILGALLPLQGLWIFHEVMAWASHPESSLLMAIALVE